MNSEIAARGFVRLYVRKEAGVDYFWGVGSSDVLFVQRVMGKPRFNISDYNYFHEQTNRRWYVGVETNYI